MSGIRRIVTAFAVVVLALMVVAPAASAGEFDIDTYLCDEFGIGCPGPDDGQLVCEPSTLAPGASSECVLSDALGCSIVATLEPDKTVLFTGDVDSDPYMFGITVPSDASTGSHALVVEGSGPDCEDFVASTGLEVVGAGVTVTSLPRTGGNIASTLGVGAALVVLGAAAVQGARSRRNRTLGV